LAEKNNFRLSKRLGQNFLTDRNIAEKIVRGSRIEKGDLVIEIGPGMGALTLAAAEIAGMVIGVEIDKSLIPILEETLSECGNVKIINDDILKTDLNALAALYRESSGNENGGVKIIGNLPYYITTPVIMKILEEKIAADSLTVMVQREVADRIKAPPGIKSYGAISVAVNYYCEVERIADVSREVFFPKPNVDSTVLRLDIRKRPPVSVADEKVFFSCVRAGFGQRRKTLLNSLTGLYGFGKPEIAGILDDSGIDPKRRAETLNIFEFSVLANNVQKWRGGSCVK